MTMKRKNRSDDLKKVLQEALEPFQCQKKMVFGSPAYFVNNNMFAGVHEDGLFIRLSEEDREKVLSTYEGTKPFMPMWGRVMKEYLEIPGSVYEDPTTLDEVLNLSYRYAASLPPAKRRRRKKTV